MISKIDRNDRIFDIFLFCENIRNNINLLIPYFFLGLLKIDHFIIIHFYFHNLTILAIFISCFFHLLSLLSSYFWILNFSINHTHENTFA